MCNGVGVCMGGGEEGRGKHRKKYLVFAFFSFNYVGLKYIPTYLTVQTEDVNVALYQWKGIHNCSIHTYT